jgi:transposase
MTNDMNAPFPAPGESAKARSAEADSPGAGAPPDAEVAAKPRRRQFTAAYRLRILEEADRCTTSGEIGQLLRREGLYSSHLSNWRKAQREGSLAALAPKKRGAKPKARNPLEPMVQQLEAENARLKAELHKAHTILDVQEKVAGLLGFSLESGKNS